MGQIENYLVETIMDKITPESEISIEFNLELDDFVVCVDGVLYREILSLRRRIGVVDTWEFLFSLGCRVDESSLPVLNNLLKENKR